MHPRVAVNIAQWISPEFDVKVSGWVYEIWATGKVDTSNPIDIETLKLEFDKKYSALEVKNQELAEEVKVSEKKIEVLQKKYCKRKKNNTENKENVVYILTTELLKSDGRYIFGKSKNMKNRLPTYNKLFIRNKYECFRNPYIKSIIRMPRMWK